MKRGIGIFYRNRLRISIIILFCITFLIGVKYLSAYSEQKFSLNNDLAHNRKLNERVIEKDISIEKKLVLDENLDKQKINEINSEFLNKINQINKQNNNNNNNVVKIENTINVPKVDNVPRENIQIPRDRLQNQNINGQQNPNSNLNTVDSTAKLLNGLERIIHIDLKGAPPKIDYLTKFIPFIKKFGATGILLEYEDTFPFEGILADAKHGNAYTIDDVNTIKKVAKENGLKIMPLVQTYGHLEWLLKVKKFAHLREVSEYPQVITPCLNESYTVLYEMLDQVIKQHNDVSEFHIGCDEVYYKLMHSSCENFPNRDNFAKAFMSHLVKIAKYIRAKLPNTKIIFWDDMMHGMDAGSLLTYKQEIESLQLQPMMWGYMENVESYFAQDLYVKYGVVFGKIWIATAYKGASGELATITSIQHHYLNHISWIDVMKEKISKNILQFIGVAITGWSRYDHFLTLCDILPESIPSLVFNLQVMQHGRLSNEKKSEITRQLGCNGEIPWNGEAYNSISCTFPGHEVYEAMLPLQSVLNTFKTDMEFARKYLSPMNLQYAYLHKKRTSEVLDRLRYTYSTMNSFRTNFITACNTMFWPDVANEWLLVYFLPQFDELYNMLATVKNLSSQNDWAPRPLPITLKQYPLRF